VPGFAVDDATLAGLPVAIAHGRQDPIITVDFGRAARDRAQQAGADVLYRESDVPHTIDPRVIPELVDWLRARAPA
jgi:phospholipase/carboxylesterase